MTSPWILSLFEVLVCIIPAAVSMQVQMHNNARTHGWQQPLLHMQESYNFASQPNIVENSRFEQCKASAQLEPTAGLKIAYILRGESFRGGNLSEHVKNQSEWQGKQFGVGKRLTCGSGSFERQESVAKKQYKNIKFLKSMGYSVDVFGATYECDDATKSDSFNFSVQDGLATLYNFTKFTLLEKKTSTQITAIRAGFHLLTEYINETDPGGFSPRYSAVIIGRWDHTPNFSRWACHLADMTWPQDLFALEGVSNEDVLMVVPQRHIKCFDEFLKEDQSTSDLACCRGHCGGGVCKWCVPNFAEAVHGQKLLRETLPVCSEYNDFARDHAVPVSPVFSDNPDWLPDSDHDCIDKKNEFHDTDPE